MFDNGNFGTRRPGITIRRCFFGIGLAALLIAVFLLGRLSLSSVARGEGAGAQTALYYVDPMHPDYRSDRPGKAPDCGMDLEPVYVAAGSAGPAAVKPRTVILAPAQEEAVRLETETVRQAPFTRELRTAGRVAPDEALTYAVSAGVDGWIRRVFADRTGTHVKRGATLASFYSKDISAPQQAYIYALDSCERLRRAASPPAEPLALATQQLATARDNLLFVGMGETQLAEIGRTRRELYDLDLTAPADGLILERRVALGQRFMRGELLYRIAGLDHIWVLADISPGDAVSAGAVGSAQVRLEGFAPVDARISPVPPQFDERGRTGKLRLEVNNASGTLLPGMVVDVTLHFASRAAITVDADALLDSGARQYVFIASGGGAYELRQVRSGSQQGGRIEILGGVEPGERVVTTGAFLLDSESRMKDLAAEVVDAECGMTLQAARARRLNWKGATYYFCSESCEHKFTARRSQ